MGDTAQSLLFSNEPPQTVVLVDKNGNWLSTFPIAGGGAVTQATSSGITTIADALGNPYGARNPQAAKITDPYYADRILQIAVDGSITALAKDYGLNAMQNAQMFTGVTGASATNGIVGGAASTQTAMSVFNPAASKKNVLILSIRPMYLGASALHNISRVTTDPAYGGTVTPSNASLGGAVSVCSVTYANSAQTVAGTVVDVIQTSTTAPEQVHHPEFCYFLPAGSANGIVFYCNMTTAASWACVFKWLEF